MPPPELPLRDIHLPEAVSWWPPAIGWWLLALLMAGVVFYALWFYKRQMKPKRIVRTAKNLLMELKQNHALTTAEKLSALSILLRRTAISVSTDPKVAGLTGQVWLAYLDQTTKDDFFCRGVGRMLVDSPYRPSPPSDTDIAQLIEGCENWLKTCTQARQNKSKP